ncbi:Sec20-domain-containing protein [Meredithblackwellia eburnea MCA 4105]
MPPPAHTPVSRPPKVSEPQLPSELLDLVASLQRVLNDLDQFQVPQLAQCKGPLSLHEQLAQDVRNEMSTVRRDIEELKLQVDDLEKARDRRAGLELVGQLQQKLTTITTKYREAVITSKQLIQAASTLSPREQLLRTNVPIGGVGRPTTGETNASADDALMAATADVTEGLRRTLQLMQQELDRSLVSAEMLQAQTATMQMTSDQYSVFSNLLATSKALITALERSDYLDRLIILFAFIFFCLVCAFIVKRRIVDKGLRVAGAVSGVFAGNKGAKEELKRSVQEVIGSVAALSTAASVAATSIFSAVPRPSRIPPPVARYFDEEDDEDDFFTSDVPVVATPTSSPAVIPTNTPSVSSSDPEPYELISDPELDLLEDQLERLGHHAADEAVGYDAAYGGAAYAYQNATEVGGDGEESSSLGSETQPTSDESATPGDDDVESQIGELDFIEPIAPIGVASRDHSINPDESSPELEELLDIMDDMVGQVSETVLDSPDIADLELEEGVTTDPPSAAPAPTTSSEPERSEETSVLGTVHAEPTSAPSTEAPLSETVPVPTTTDAPPEPTLETLPLADESKTTTQVGFDQEPAPASPPSIAATATQIQMPESSNPAARVEVEDAPELEERSEDSSSAEAAEEEGDEDEYEEYEDEEEQPEEGSSDQPPVGEQVFEAHLFRPANPNIDAQAAIDENAVEPPFPSVVEDDRVFSPPEHFRPTEYVDPQKAIDDNVVSESATAIADEGESQVEGEDRIFTPLDQFRPTEYVQPPEAIDNNVPEVVVEQPVAASEHEPALSTSDSAGEDEDEEEFDDDEYEYVYEDDEEDDEGEAQERGDKGQQFVLTESDDLAEDLVVDSPVTEGHDGSATSPLFSEGSVPKVDEDVLGEVEVEEPFFDSLLETAREEEHQAHDEL